MSICATNTAANLSVVVIYLWNSTRRKHSKMNSRQFRRKANRIAAKHFGPKHSWSIENAPYIANHLPQFIGTHPEANNVAFNVTYREVTGHVATLEGMNVLLRQLNVNDVLRTIATLNNRFCMDVAISHQELFEQQVRLVRQLCSPGFQHQIFASPFGKGLRHDVFHRQQQLFVLRHALMECQYDGGLPWNIEALNLFAEACVMASDLVDAELPTDQTEDGNILVTKMMVKTSELALDNDPINIVGRAIQLWLRIPEEAGLSKSKNHMSFADEFHEANDMDLETFMRVLYLLMAQSMRTDEPNKEPWSQFVINVKTFFANTNYSEETARKVLAVLSCPLSTIRNEIPERTAKRHGYALAALERFPFIQVDDHVFVFYDRKFLLRFFTHGIWWNIHDSLPEYKKGRFRTFFGEVFEIYINRVLTHACRSSTKMHLYDKLKFNATDQICDALVETDDAWVLIETKAALLKHKSKYSDDAAILKADIIDRFWGREDSPKGARQLARSIKRLLVNGERDTASRLDIGKRKIIYPVLVSYDTTVCNKFVANLLDHLLRQELGTIPLSMPCIKPLTILSTEDVEAITSLSYQYTLPRLLASYRMESAPLLSFQSHICQRYQKDVDVEKTYSLVNYSALHDMVAGDMIV